MEYVYVHVYLHCRLVVTLTTEIIDDLISLASVFYYNPNYYFPSKVHKHYLRIWAWLACKHSQIINYKLLYYQYRKQGQNISSVDLETLDLELYIYIYIYIYNNNLYRHKCT